MTSITQELNHTYDPANRLTSVNGQAVQWDDNGNMLADSQAVYKYNTANKLVGVTKGTSSIVYAYSGLGDRLKQIADGVTTDYTLDINTGLTQVLDDGTNKYLYGNSRIAQIAETQTGYFLPDALGSMRQMTDPSADLTLARTYDPYGNIVSSSGAGETVYGYTGEMQSGGLVHLRARDYASYLIQFIQPDTYISDPFYPSSLNRYVYVRGNPIYLTDPSGHNFTCVNCEPLNPRDLTRWLHNEMTWNAKNHWSVKFMKAENDLALQNFIKGNESLRECNKELALLYFSQATVAHGSALTVFYFMVKDGGPWDFKDEIGTRLGPGITICTSNSNCFNDIEYSVPGNIHYGYIGLAAGFTSAEIKFGAGWAEKNDPSHNPKNPAYSGPYLGGEDFSNYDEDEWNYGDETRDNTAVTLGIKMWKKSQENLSYEEFMTIMGEKISGLDRCTPSPETVSSDDKKAWPYTVGYFNNQGRTYVKKEGACK